MFRIVELNLQILPGLLVYDSVQTVVAGAASRGRGLRR
jgi:hypothetical protein